MSRSTEHGIAHIDRYTHPLYIYNQLIVYNSPTTELAAGLQEKIIPQGIYCTIQQ